ncbi:potassium voltage-gated channel subfamily A member 2-like isoform X2 [Xenia sp. Carnegie-2017]|uniref:potassium voltage-gated channel subfamily A member 2-like isoform X2 n=1 Tax=Xenia sp. Carnegie-2017 TaxID=2897299 RepID=UPI001F0387AA|nr:potassium voltage-gated channel subfamily A member 2-like isoform X2 [Xenia sp. Carnegie-2017]
MTSDSGFNEMNYFFPVRPNSEFRDFNSSEQPMKFIINVSGLRFETYKQTVEQLPDSVLGSELKRSKYWDSENNEYFFDRNRTCFEAILTYYQTRGTLIRPEAIPMNIFVDEVKFFELGEQAMWQATEGYDGFEENYEKSTNRFQCTVWELFEHPGTSNFAKVIAVFSVSIILISVALFCIETLPSFQENQTKKNGSEIDSNVDNHYTSATFTIEAFCISWFTLEYVVRLLSSPNKWKFVISVLNIIDFIAIIPFYIGIAVDISNSGVSSIAMLRIVRLVRVFRIFKLSRYSRGLQILGHTLRSSIKELGLLLFFLCMGVVLFSSAIYYAESNDKFISIPHSFWWSIITMTTVGYGDYVPKTGGLREVLFLLLFQLWKISWMFLCDHRSVVYCSACAGYCRQLYILLFKRAQA